MQFFVEVIDNEKNLRNVRGQIMMCTSCMSNYYLYDFFRNSR
jgi:hypothetical protein